MTTVHRPSTCKHCQAPLTWTRAAAYYAVCTTCQLTTTITPRRCPPAVMSPLLAADATLCRIAVTSGLDLRPLASDLPAGRHVVALRANHAVDSRYAGIHQHPYDADVCVVVRQHVPIAALPLRTARRLRADVIARWSRAAPCTRVNENDVASEILAVCLAAPPSSTRADAVPTLDSIVANSPARGRRFLGDTHVFAPWGTLFEPGFLRPATLPRSLLTMTSPLVHSKAYLAANTDPSTSAYAPIDAYGLSVDADAHRRLLGTIDHPLACQLVNCLRFGFPLLATPPLTTSTVTYPPAPLDCCPAAVAAADADIARGGIADVIDWPGTTPTRISPLFHRPKGDSDVRAIPDMSAGYPSVNACTRRNGLPPPRLVTWPRIARRILYMRGLRPGVPLRVAKVDLRHAYRHLGIPLRDRWMTLHRLHSHGGRLVCHQALPFGACASCQHMAAASAAVEDLLAAQSSIFAPVFIDDSLVVAFEDTMDADLRVVFQTWADLGWSVNMTKFERDGRPASCMDFLGVALDVNACTASVTADRMVKLIALVDSLLVPDPRAPTPRQYAALAGKLGFVASVIPFGRTFVTPIHVAASSPPSTVISDDVTVALQWWRVALPELNGVATFRAPPRDDASVTHVYTDASGSGFGVWAPTIGDNGSYCSGVWSTDERRETSTAHWELAAIVIAVCVIGPRTLNGDIIIHSDSSASVAAMRRHSARDPQLHRLINFCALLQLRLKVTITVQHIKGIHNDVADALSRHNRIPDHLAAATRLPVPFRRPVLALTAPPLPPPPPTAPTTPCAGSVRATSLQPRTSLDRSGRRPLHDFSLNTAMKLATPSARPLIWTLWSAASTARD